MSLFYSKLSTCMHTAFWLCIAALFSTSYAQAQIVNHMTQQDVLDFLQDYQPEVVSAEGKMRFSDLVAELQEKRVVFVGERHNRYDHHLNQLAILKAMHAQNPQLALGLEWFQQPFQAVLDAYVADKISKTELLKQSEYYQRWGYDFRQLRAILEFAKDKQIPVLALNAQSEITRQVSREGLDSLDETLRKQIPATIHPPNETYRAYLKQVFERHRHGQGSFERFVTVQRIWDETMAMNAVNYLRQHPEQRMLILAGSGHTGKNVAIPADLARSIPAEQLVTVLSVEADKVETGKVDYFILTEKLSLPPAGKLGIWLDEQAEGIRVGKLTEASAAGAAGAQQGDRLISLDNIAIDSTAALMVALGSRQPGDQVKLTLEREGKLLVLEFSLQ